MTIGLYIRVSTQEQAKEGYSIPAQKERLMGHCSLQGWDDYKFYVDEGVSAKDTNRPELKRLLEDVKKNKISMILVYRLDRFTRSVRDLYNILETLDKYKCAFASATEPYDTSNAMGRMFIGLVALLAQWETENLSERVKMALEEKVSGGERVGNIPYGFDLDENEQKLIPNDKDSVVLMMIEKTKQGMSASQLSKYLNKVNNDRVWHPQGILRVLRNPALYGATRWNDDVYENTHTEIITKDEFLRLQEILEDRSLHHNRAVESVYLFQGVLSCPRCKRPLSVNRYVRKRKDGTQYQGAIYKCQACWKEGHGMLSIGEQRFVEALMDYMRNLDIDKKYFDFNQLDKPDDERAELSKQLQKIEKSREKYQRAWALDLISDKEFEKRMEETRETYDELKNKLSKIKTPVQIDTEVIKELVFNFNENFTFLTDEERKAFISQFIRRIDFRLETKPPIDRRSKKGKETVIIENIEFY